MRRLLAVGLAVGLPAVFGASAAADATLPGVRTGSSGATYTGAATLSGNKASGGTTTGRTRSGYTAPVCWYEPTYTSEELVRSVSRQAKLWHVEGLSKEYKDWKTSFGDYHFGQKGKYWTITCRDSSDEAMAWLNSHEYYRWVADGQPVPPEVVPSTEEVAQEVLANLTLPKPKVTLSPQGKSYVNMPTWIWVDQMVTVDGDAQAIGPITQSGGRPGALDITLTATPQRLVISSGTTSDRARVIAGPGGICPGYGKPYAKGETPTCAVTYLRSTADRQDGYPLEVELVWKVTWEVTFAADGVQGARADDFDPQGMAADIPPIQVAEVQSVVESSR